MDWIRGKRRGDIELPNESGEVDERLLDLSDKSWNSMKRLASRVQRLKQRTPKRISRR